MEQFSELYSKYKTYILFVLLLIIFLISSALIFYHFETNINNLKKQLKERPVVEVRNEGSNDERLVVDIKGAVRKPGVYYLEKGKRVIDVVNKAGGFTNSADSSANNLSMKIKDEMVIAIYTKDEISNYLETKEKEQTIKEKCQNDKVQNSSCVNNVNGEEKETKNIDTSSSKTNKATSKTKSESATKNDNQSNEKVSINTATKEQLMTLTGIGESKADAIIEYRENKKFETIEELKEVSGIGDSLFEKIKDHITT